MDNLIGAVFFRREVARNTFSVVTDARCIAKLQFPFAELNVHSPSYFLQFGRIDTAIGSRDANLQMTIKLSRIAYPVNRRNLRRRSDIDRIYSR